MFYGSVAKCPRPKHDSNFYNKTRLKKIQAALDEPDENFFQLISKSDLKKNLEYFVQVLDNVLLDERKQVHSYKLKFFVI